MVPANQSNADLPDRETLDLITACHENRGERLVAKTKSRSTPKGQFGIKFLMIVAVVAAIFFSIPNFFGINNVGGYWMGIASLSALLAPMLGFLSSSGATLLGFRQVHRRAIGWTIGVATGGPIVIYLLATGERMEVMQVFGIAWTLQFGAIFLSSLIFK